MKKIIAGYIAPIILLAGGVLFIALGIRGIGEAKNFTPVSAVVTHIEVTESVNEDGITTTDERVTAAYTYEGREYVVEVQDAKQGLAEGQEITVLVNPEKPEYASMTTTSGGVVRIIFGTVLALAGLVTLLRPFIAVAISKKSSAG